MIFLVWESCQGLRLAVILMSCKTSSQTPSSEDSMLQQRREAVLKAALLYSTAACCKSNGTTVVVCIGGTIEACEQSAVCSGRVPIADMTVTLQQQCAVLVSQLGFGRGKGHKEDVLTTPSTRSSRESCHPMSLRALQRAANSIGLKLLSSGMRCCRIGATLGPIALP